MAADLSIPRHPRGRLRGPLSARFVTYGDRVVLVDELGNRFPMEMVSMAASFYGATEGAMKLPRPWTYDANGQPTIRGDIVVIDFINGSAKRPIVLSSVVRLQRDDPGFLPYSHRDLGANALRMRVTPLDESGAEAGRIDVRLADDDKGSIDVRATSRIELRVASDLDARAPLRLEIDAAAGTVSIGVTPDSEQQVALVRSDIINPLIAALKDIAAGMLIIPSPSTNVLALITALENGLFTTSTLKAE